MLNLVYTEVQHDIWEDLRRKQDPENWLSQALTQIPDMFAKDMLAADSNIMTEKISKVLMQNNNIITKYESEIRPLNNLNN